MTVKKDFEKFLKKGAQVSEGPSEINWDKKKDLWIDRNFPTEEEEADHQDQYQLQLQQLNHQYYDRLSFLIHSFRKKPIKPFQIMIFLVLIF